jgi:S-adenosylmethionine synthetase
MMFGYATDETDNYMPLALDLSHRILIELADIRREGKEMTYLRPDSKSQVTIEYSDDNQPIRIEAIVVSTQHDEFVLAENDSESAKAAAETAMQQQIENDVKTILIPRVLAQLEERQQVLFGTEKYHVNPTGKFVIGGPHGDTGLTGRKIIVDTYGGKGAHGGGAFSGKDPSKVDRSAAYATRHIAKNLVAAGLCKQVLVQVSYAIGVAKPMGIFVDTYGTAKVDLTDGDIAKKVEDIFDMRPAAIIERLKLKTPIYQETAAYGHMGRTPQTKTFSFNVEGQTKEMTLETFTWEKLDYVDKVKATFGL